MNAAGFPGLVDRPMSDRNFPSLVSCTWLKEQIEKGLPDDVVIADVSWSSKKNCYHDYMKCHIPGAVFINVMESEHTDIYPRNIPKSVVFERNVQSAGINDGTHVIIYSDSDNYGYFMSCRAWWTFKIFNEHTTISVLDGGLQKWKALGYTTTDNVINISQGSFKAKWNPFYYKYFDEVLKNVKDKEYQKMFYVCDCRSSSAYEGTDSLGHIAGASNLPYGNLMDKDHLILKPMDQLFKAFENAGVDISRNLVTHCNGGMSSCTVAFVAELLGAKKVAVFHGGFTEWKARAPPDYIERSHSS